jgi:hypothetical protein
MSSGRIGQVVSDMKDWNRKGLVLYRDIQRSPIHRWLSEKGVSLLVEMHCTRYEEYGLGRTHADQKRIRPNLVEGIVCRATGRKKTL